MTTASTAAMQPAGQVDSLPAVTSRNFIHCRHHACSMAILSPRRLSNAEMQQQDSEQDRDEAG